MKNKELEKLVSKVIELIDSDLIEQLKLDNADKESNSIEVITKSKYLIDVKISKIKDKELTREEKIAEVLRLHQQYGLPQIKITKRVGVSQKWVSLILQSNSKAQNAS